MTGSEFSQSSEDEQRRLRPDRPPRAVWPWILVLAAMLLLVAWRLSSSGTAPLDSQGPRHPAVGTRLSGVSLAPLVGPAEPLTDDDLSGKVTLINFWGPWCQPCAVEFPHVAELEQHFRKDADFRFVSVSSNPNPDDETNLKESTQVFLKQHRADFPVHRDPGGATQDAIVRQAQLAGFGFPTTLVLDRQGTVRALWTGYRDGLEREMRDVVAHELAASPPADKKS